MIILQNNPRCYHTNGFCCEARTSPHGSEGLHQLEWDLGVVKPLSATKMSNAERYSQPKLIDRAKCG